MRTVAVTNHKGGSAKTTTTVNLAAALGEAGQRVLVIDMDPQGSASAWLGISDPTTGVIQAIRGLAPLASLLYETTAPGVQLVPSSPGLVVSDGREETDIAMGFIKAMEQLPSMWDIVLVDCPPSMGYLGVAPIAICREILVPVEVHVLALAGLASLLATVRRVQSRLNPSLEITAVLACRVNRTSHARVVIERLRESFPDTFMATEIRESIRVAEAPGMKLPITRYAPGSTGDRDYRAAASEFLQAVTEGQPVAEQEEESSRLSRMFRSSRHRPWVSRGSPLQIEPRRTLESRRGGD